MKKAYAVVDSDNNLSYWLYRSENHLDTHTIGGIFMKRREADRFIKSWQSSGRKNLKIVPIEIKVIAGKYHQE